MKAAADAPAFTAVARLFHFNRGESRRWYGICNPYPACLTIELASGGKERQN